MRPTWPPTQPSITGGQLALRPWQASDAEVVATACQDPLIQRYTRVPVPYLISDAQEFIRTSADAWASGAEANYAVVEHRQVVGAISLMSFDHQQATAEIGYWVAPWARGRGIARTAIGMIADWGAGELGLQRFLLQIEDESVASVAAALAAGAVRSGEVAEAEVRGTARGLRQYWLGVSGAAHPRPA